MQKLNSAFSFTSYSMITADEMKIVDHIVPRKVTYQDLLKKCDIGCSTVIYDINILGKQYFDEKSPKAREDYILWLKISKLYSKELMLGINKPLMRYRKHNLGISSNKSKAIMNVWRVYREFEKLNFFQALFYIIRYSLYGIK